MKTIVNLCENNEPRRILRVKCLFRKNLLEYNNIIYKGKIIFKLRSKTACVSSKYENANACSVKCERIARRLSRKWTLVSRGEPAGTFRVLFHQEHYSEIF